MTGYKSTPVYKCPVARSHVYWVGSVFSCNSVGSVWQITVVVVSALVSAPEVFGNSVSASASVSVTLTDTAVEAEVMLSFLKPQLLKVL